MQTDVGLDADSWGSAERVYPDGGREAGSGGPWSDDRALVAMEVLKPRGVTVVPARLAPEVAEPIHLVAHHLRVFGALGAEAAARAAVRCDEADVQLMQTALRGIDRGILQGSDGSREYVDFHLAVASASANPSLVKTLAAMRNTHIAVARVTRACEAKRLDFALEVRRELEDILFSIEMGDGASARRAGQNHAMGAVRRIFEVDIRFWRQKGQELVAALREVDRRCGSPVAATDVSPR